MPTLNIHLRRSAVVAICGAVAVCVLSACAAPGGNSDDQMARFLVAPGKYVLYSCDELARQAQASAARKKELEQLMAKASSDAGGRMISNAAYGSEYTMVRGELIELHNAANERNCNAAPGAGNPSGRASDNAIR